MPTLGKARFDPENDQENAASHDMDPSPGDAVQSTVRMALEKAVQHYKEHLEPHQVEATEYYDGLPFGDEEEGRSQVVSTDVQDATDAQMASLLDVFFGPDRAVEFEPRGLEDEPLAKQMTEYVNFVATQDNPGYVIFQDWMEDALVRRLGVVKFWWNDLTRVEESRHTGLPAEAVQMLLQTEGEEAVHIDKVRATPEGEVYDVTVRRTDYDGCAKYAALPPEEFVFTPGARSLDEAPLVAHVREVTVDELRQMEIPEELIESAIEAGNPNTDDDLASVRRYDRGEDDDAESGDESQRKVLFAEAYLLVDGDGDGIAERRMFQCVGREYRIANGDGLGEIVHEVPFAALTPYRRAHQLVGRSNHDKLKDVQRVKSQVLRETLNSLAQAVTPKTEVVEGEVNMGDLLNPEVSGILRVRKPGMLREIGHAFVGADTLPVLAYYDEIKENRTGQSKASQGLDADSLQSATKAAVAATISASQQRTKMIARNFAETGMKRLFKGLLGLVVRNQRRSRVVRLRNEYVEVDPRSWDATMDVRVNVGVGQGAPEDRIQALAGILGKQMELMQAGSPLVGWTQVRASLAKAVDLVGLGSANAFFKPFGPQEEQMMAQQMAQQPPQQDPAMMVAQVEMQKAQAQMQVQQMKAQTDSQVEQAKLELERWRIQMEDDREREKIARDSALKEMELELKYRSDIADAVLAAKVATDRAQMDVQTAPEAE